MPIFVIICLIIIIYFSFKKATYKSVVTEEQRNAWRADKARARREGRPLERDAGVEDDGNWLD